MADVASLWPHEVILFLNEHTTMTLATTDADGHPAAAALFYAILDDMLIFLSEEKTAHVQNLLRHPRAALTVHRDGQLWQELRGLQARGTALSLPEVSWTRAWQAYEQRFPFVKRARVTHNEDHVLAGPLAQARWYAVKPLWVRLIDNRRGFGWKAEWQREEGGTWRRIR